MIIVTFEGGSGEGKSYWKKKLIELAKAEDKNVVEIFGDYEKSSGDNLDKHGADIVIVEKNN